MVIAVHVDYVVCCMQQWVIWAGGEEKRRLEIGADSGTGSGAESRD